jgi:CPA1 family monovalent cation:H+ antiporter
MRFGLPLAADLGPTFGQLCFIVVLARLAVSVEVGERLAARDLRGAVLVSGRHARPVALAPRSRCPSIFRPRPHRSRLRVVTAPSVATSASVKLAPASDEDRSPVEAPPGLLVQLHVTSPAAMILRKQYSAARHVAEDENAPQAATEFDRLRLRAIEAQRRTLHELRRTGRISDDVFHRLQEELDWSELDAAPAGRFQSLMG